MAFYEKYLKDDEQLIRIIRRYWLTFIIPGLLSAVLILIPFFFLIPLFAAGRWGIIGFSVLLFIGGIYCLRTIVVGYFNCFIVTDRRIVDHDQSGLFERNVSEAPYNLSLIHI